MTLVPRPPFVTRVPDGDNRERDVCGQCGFIHYVNPKVVAGAVIVEEGKVLLCRRAIQPRRGYWTIPAGFMEVGETVEDGAKREAQEEAMARISLDGLLGLYSIPRIGQVQAIFRARLIEPGFGVGQESLEARLFAWDEIPWTELAFPSVHWALNHWRETIGLDTFPPRSNPEGDLGLY
ncbi:MAG: NUDIX domain-containing protein [Alphaproteobacteria bacterium]|nr:NUDIX domain-containing protein [Alphaproteobacteria bacterium]